MKYQKVHTKIWNDDKFPTLSIRGQRFFLYLLTSPHSNLIGMYVLKPGYACDDLKSLPKDFQKDLAEVLAKDLIKYDNINQIVLLPRYLEYNPLTNPNQVIAAISIIKDSPQTPLLQDLKVLVEGLPKGLTKGLLKVLTKDFSSYTDTDTDTNPPTPLTKGEEVDDKRVKKKEPYSEGFLRFLAVYPKLRAKEDAWKAWNQMAKKRPSDDELIATVEVQKKSEEWQRDNGKYIPYPATWLRQGRWADKIEVKKREVPATPPHRADSELCKALDEEKRKALEAREAEYQERKRLGLVKEYGPKHTPEDLSKDLAGKIKA